MRIIVVGGGKIGLSLAETLAMHKHDVIIIEAEKKKCQEIVEEFNGIVIYGDATEIEVLKEAKVDRADVFVAVTSSEEVNLLSCLLAKEISKAKTLARVIKPSYEKLFKKAGIDMVLSPEVALASSLESMIIEPDVLDIAVIHRGDIEMLEFTVKEKSKADGRSIKEIEQPKGVIIIAVKENNKFEIPGLDMKLKAGDKVIVLAKKELERKMEKIFSD